jgi:hypothetical protein
VSSERPSDVCLQETKLPVISDFDLIQLLGPGFNYSYLPSEQTHGGILAAWHSDMWSASCASSQCYSVSVKLKHVNAGKEWWLTTVYGPARVEEKLRQVWAGP